MTKFIRIGIADKNDNPPYFDKNLYEAEVDENEDIQHTVLTVTAKDHDECKYLNISFIIKKKEVFFPSCDIHTLLDLKNMYYQTQYPHTLTHFFYDDYYTKILNGSRILSNTMEWMMFSITRKSYVFIEIIFFLWVVSPAVCIIFFFLLRNEIDLCVCAYKLYNTPNS